MKRLPTSALTNKNPKEETRAIIIKRIWWSSVLHIIYLCEAPWQYVCIPLERHRHRILVIAIAGHSGISRHVNIRFLKKKKSNILDATLFSIVFLIFPILTSSSPVFVRYFTMIRASTCKRIQACPLLPSKR